MHNPEIPVAPASPSTSAADCELALMLLGPSTAMAHLWSQIRRLAPHVRTVLLTGPEHAGQEAAARLLLDLSPHPQRPFLVLRDATAEERLTRATLANSLPQELFLFLPEIDRLSAAGQNSLLRLLRTRRGRGLCVVAAAVEDLRALVSVGKFSAELAETLGAVRVTVPALKDRIEDLPMLLGQMLSVRCQSLAQAVPRLSEDLLRAAMQHAWPGNLLELSGVADTLVKDAVREQELRAADLMHAIASQQVPRSSGASPIRMVKLDTVVQEHIFAVLRGCRGNKLRAADVLGISRSTLYRMLDAAAQNTSFSLAS